MVLHKCMKMAPQLGRRLAATTPCPRPWPLQPVQQVRSLFTPWPRTGDIGALIRDMDRQMDRLERQVFRGAPSWFQRPAGGLPIGALDDKQYRFAVDLAGFKPEEIKLALDDAGRRLTIEAKCERRGADGSTLAQEVSRTIALPEAVDAEHITSVLHHDGVLAIEAPFREQPKLQQEPLSIPISRSGSGGEQQAQLQAQPHKEAKEGTS